jgi:hypothetical protein
LAEPVSLWHCFCHFPLAPAIPREPQKEDNRFPVMVIYFAQFGTIEASSQVLFRRDGGACQIHIAANVGQSRNQPTCFVEIVGLL